MSKLCSSVYLSIWRRRSKSSHVALQIYSSSVTLSMSSLYSFLSFSQRYRPGPISSKRCTSLTKKQSSLSQFKVYSELDLSRSRSIFRVSNCWYSKSSNSGFRSYLSSLVYLILALNSCIGVYNSVFFLARQEIRCPKSTSQVIFSSLSTSCFKIDLTF